MVLIKMSIDFHNRMEKFLIHEPVLVGQPISKPI